MQKRLLVISISAFMIQLYLPSLTIHAQSQDIIEVGKFSAGTMGDTLPPGWKPLTFKKIERHTTYTLIKVDNTVVVKAVAEASASGLTREIKINPKEYPIVQWRWKIMNILKKGTYTERKETITLHGSILLSNTMPVSWDSSKKQSTKWSNCYTESTRRLLQSTTSGKAKLRSAQWFPTPIQTGS